MAAFVGCSDQHEAATDPPASTGESAGPFEVQFMTSMIAHHRGAVTMAQLCLERAERAELRELCEDIIADQEREIADMQGWLEAWYDVEHAQETHPPSPHEHGMTDLSSLHGEQFEAAFLDEMIAHHATAVDDAAECKSAAVHEELLSLCENIGSSQRREIERMASWQKAWFGGEGR
jgi:uncharacterized protein (DUF305 family)